MCCAICVIDIIHHGNCSSLVCLFHWLNIVGEQSVLWLMNAHNITLFQIEFCPFLSLSLFSIVHSIFLKIENNFSDFYKWYHFIVNQRNNSTKYLHVIFICLCKAKKKMNKLHNFVLRQLNTCRMNTITSMATIFGIFLFSLRFEFWWHDATQSAEENFPENIHFCVVYTERERVRQKARKRLEEKKLLCRE